MSSIAFEVRKFNFSQQRRLFYEDIVDHNIEEAINFYEKSVLSDFPEV